MRTWRRRRRISRIRRSKTGTKNKIKTRNPETRRERGNTGEKSEEYRGCEAGAAMPQQAEIPLAPPHTPNAFLRFFLRLFPRSLRVSGFLVLFFVSPPPSPLLTFGRLNFFP